MFWCFPYRTSVPFEAHACEVFGPDVRASNLLPTGGRKTLLNPGDVPEKLSKWSTSDGVKGLANSAVHPSAWLS